jgi:exonuclease III
MEILCWNARGLNDPAKRSAICDFLDSVSVSIVCLQETRLNVIDDFIVMRCLGPSFNGYAYFPVVETRGGILFAWNKTMLGVTRVSFDMHAITGEVIPRDDTIGGSPPFKRWQTP